VLPGVDRDAIVYRSEKESEQASQRGEAFLAVVAYVRRTQTVAAAHRCRQNGRAPRPYSGGAHVLEENKALVRRFFEAFFDNDAAALEEVTSQDVVYHTAPPGLSAGIQGYRELMAMYHGAFPDLRLTIDDRIAEGEKVVTRFTGSGTHRGDFMGIAPTGKQAAAGGISIVRVS
jgi:predicted ester cyclase